MTVLLNAYRDWHCPNCGKQARELTTVPNVWHVCPRLRGLNAPLVVGDAKVFARDREDYVRDERVTTDEAGRPVMSIVTERPDGSNDAIVFAPVATLTGRST